MDRDHCFDAHAVFSFLAQVGTMEQQNWIVYTVSVYLRTPAFTLMGRQGNLRHTGRPDACPWIGYIISLLLRAFKRCLAVCSRYSKRRRFAGRLRLRVRIWHTGCSKILADGVRALRSVLQPLPVFSRGSLPLCFADGRTLS